MSIDQTPGFFGKVSTQGDFVSRRLPVDFLDPWDRWLQQSLQKSREQLGATWLDTYLTSPVWRFALAPGVCGSHAWGGVLMPSVDRVGRHFPLTVAAMVPGQGGMLNCLSDAKDWYDCVESLALRTLDKDCALDAFDAELVGVPSLSVTASTIQAKSEGQSNRGYCLPIAGLQQIRTSMHAIAQEIGKLGAGVSSMWWSEGSARVAPSLLVCEGLPAQGSFAAMLDGDWVRWGWRVRARLF